MSNAIDFSSVLAAAIHDMKNSLSLLIQTIESLDKSIDAENEEAHGQLSQVHYEAARLNTGLVQMLSLYRAELSGLPLNVDEHFIDDLFAELQGANRTYIAQRKVALNFDFDSEINWFFDKDLIYLLLNDVLINAMRYGNQQINVTALVEEGQLIIRIEDDGNGYPEQMLEQSNSDMSDFNVSQGRTGLGLFFARLIAQAHSNHGKQGFITLKNGGSLGGSVFQVNLP
jgi:signal transduction histidine kinase